MKRICHTAPMRLPSLPRSRLRGIALALLALFCLNIARYAVWPPVGPLARDNPETTAFMEYRQEEWGEKERKKTIRRVWKPLRSIAAALRKAVVVAEDSTFWSHAGFDFTGMRKAMERNITRGRLAAGGSTITQQLAKNLYFNPGKSVIRKFQEALVVIRLEATLPKERILELYLNCVEWGDGIFGAEAAARHYFGVSASRLTEYQAAILAAMLPSPMRYSPASRYVRKQAGTIRARMRIE